MSYSRHTLSLVTVLLILSALGAGVVWRLRGAEPADSDADAGQDAIGLPPGEAPAQFSASVAQPVRGAEVIRDTLWIRVSAAGQAEAFRRTTITAQVEGLVRAVPVRENQTVRVGDRLLQIDTTELALDVAQARADLLAAETEYRQRSNPSGLT